MKAKPQERPRRLFSWRDDGVSPALSEIILKSMRVEFASEGAGNWGAPYFGSTDNPWLLELT